MRRILEILGRKKKNNPILIGEPGVGKSAVVEGLALRMVAGQVPETMKGKRILSLDLGGFWLAPSSGVNLRIGLKTS